MDNDLYYLNLRMAVYALEEKNCLETREALKKAMVECEHAHGKERMEEMLLLADNIIKASKQPSKASQ